ncbi:MAG TPA: vitamin K epoxide reductase family protein [Gaiellaceae bacterium]
MTLRRASAALALVGAGIAGYLTYVHYAHVQPLCTTGGCEKVQASTYAELLGIPVALLGLAAYATLFALAWIRGATAALASTLVALIGVGFSGYLLWAQLGPIDAICQWCVAQDVVMAAIAVLCVARLLREP